MSGTERGILVEEREQLKLELTQEEFFCNQLPNRRQMAIIGIAFDILVTVLFLGIIAWITLGTFGIVVAPVAFGFWIIWVITSFKRIGPDVKLLRSEGMRSITLESQKKQEKLKKQIKEIQNQLDAIPVGKWMP